MLEDTDFETATAYLPATCVYAIGRGQLYVEVVRQLVTYLKAYSQDIHSRSLWPDLRMTPKIILDAWTESITESDVQEYFPKSGPGLYTLGHTVDVDDLLNYLYEARLPDADTTLFESTLAEWISERTNPFRMLHIVGFFHRARFQPTTFNPIFRAPTVLAAAFDTQARACLWEQVAEFAKTILPQDVFEKMATCWAA